MAIYYAIVRDGFVQVDAMNGHIEIYEDKCSANKSKPSGCDVVRIEVLRLPEIKNAPVDENQAEA